MVPYLYGGSTLDCAIFETVFHDVPVDAADKFVDLDDFAQRGHGELDRQPGLETGTLRARGCTAWKVPKGELIASPARDYLDTALWAQALHRQFPDVDGLLWMSRQRDRDHALVLFGDRLRGVLSGSRIGGPLARKPTLRDAVLQTALRAGIEAD